MKVTVNIDCTPEEARRFMGLPDLSGAQQAVVDEWQRRALEALDTLDPQNLFKGWVPQGNEAWDQMQKAFWSAMTDPSGDADRKK